MRRSSTGPTSWPWATSGRAPRPPIALAKRQRFPDIALGLGYSQTGSGAGVNAPIQPPTVTLTLSAPLPLFYQMQGEVRKAEANYDAQSLGQAKADAQVVSDVSAGRRRRSARRAASSSAWRRGACSGARRRPATSRARSTSAARGPSWIFLDAQRTYIATNVEYIQDLTSYWTAVFQLEQAVGMELRQ